MSATIGHNSGDPVSSAEVPAAHIRAFLERIEKLLKEKKALADDVREVFAEAKGTGFDVPTLRSLIKIRAEDRDRRREREEILALYLSALGIE